MSKNFFEKAGKQVKKRFSEIFTQHPNPIPMEPNTDENVRDIEKDGPIEEEIEEEGENAVEESRNELSKKKGLVENHIPKVKSDHDVMNDDWVITPDEISRTLSKQQELIDNLNSNSKKMRENAIRQLKVNFKYDSLFGLKCLDQLFSVFTQYSHNDLVEVEILKLISSVVEKSLQICIAKYSVHFYNFIKILTKCQKIKFMSQDNPLGKGNIFFLKKLLRLFMIDEEESQDDVKEIAFPILLELSNGNKNFSGYSNVLLNNFRRRFISSKNAIEIHLSLLLEIFCNYFPEKIEKIFFIFYPKLSDTENSFKKETEEVFLKFLKKNIEVFKEVRAGLFPPRCSVQNFNQTAEKFHLKMSTAGFQKRISTTLDIVYYVAKRNPKFLEPYISMWSEIFFDRKLRKYSSFNQIYSKFVLILTQVCPQFPLLIYRQVNKMFEIFKVNFIYEVRHDAKVNRVVTNLLSFLGFNLKNLEFVEVVVKMLLETIDFKVGDDLTFLSFKALENIVDSGKGKIVAVITKFLHPDPDVYINHQNMEIRNTVRRLLSISSSSSMVGGEIGKVKEDSSQMFLEMQQTVDSMNLKLAEQNLTFARLKTKVNELEKKMYAK